MWKSLLSVMVIVFLALTLIPGQTADPEPANDDGKSEVYIKKTVLEKDLQITDRLCRTQCINHFRKFLEQTPMNPNHDQVKTEMEKLQQKYRHIEHLVFAGNNHSPLKYNIKVRELDPSLAKAVAPYMQDAKAAGISGELYQSPAIHVNDETYFVLAVPSATKSHSLVGVIHQEILHDVAIQERKDLRMVPYPSDHRPRIKSADPQSLRDVKVNDPEDNEGTGHYRKNQVVVKFKHPLSEDQVNRIQSEIQCIGFKKFSNIYVFESKRMSAKQLMNYFQKWDIEYAEPNFLYLTNDVPNDPLYNEYQWNLPIIETENGWTFGKGSEDVVVAVIDTGVDINHPDLMDQFVQGYNFINEGRDPLDDVGHGTHVAGVVSAVVNNVEGIAGMSWYNKIMPIKVLDHTGAGSTYNVALGIIWAVDHGADVINMSLGNYTDAEFLHDAIKYAYNKDVILVAATGNDNTADPGYPAAYPEVLAVSATDAGRQKAPFSNYGEYVDVVAPGVNIPSTYPQNQYAALSGTSMASPHAAALAAMIRSANPALKNSEIMDIIRKAANDLGQKGKDPYYGFGQIDVVRSLNTATQAGYSITYWADWGEDQLRRLRERYES
jgi:thermitase